MMETRETMPAEGNNGEDKEVIVINEVDRLKAENLQLRLMNLAHERSAVLQELQRKDAALHDQQTAFRAFQEELEKKYGVDFKTHEMDADTGIVRKRK